LEAWKSSGCRPGRGGGGWKKANRREMAARENKRAAERERERERETGQSFERERRIREIEFGDTDIRD